MSNIGHVPEELAVGRGDPAYMAHAYLTKVPVPAIEPFIQAHTPPGGTVIDPFAGFRHDWRGGRTVGAHCPPVRHQRAGRHIGRNFVNLVDPELFGKAAAEVDRASREEIGDVYAVDCARCGSDGTLVKSVWSILIECSGCAAHVNYYSAMEAADWRKADMTCPQCQTPISSRNRRVTEEPVLDSVDCDCSPVSSTNRTGR